MPEQNRATVGTPVAFAQIGIGFGWGHQDRLNQPYQREPLGGGTFLLAGGFGAFSYGHSQLKGVSNYIRDQVRHHARRTFPQEYLQFLKKFEIEHDERYIFKPLEEK